MPPGFANWALAAGPLSPLKPAVPFPATRGQGAGCGVQSQDGVLIHEIHVACPIGRYRLGYVVAPSWRTFLEC